MGGNEMVVEWNISNDRLLERYAVVGSFYQLKLRDEMTKISCRNDLHIIDKAHQQENGGNSKAQLLMIMMNPGKSRPLRQTTISEYGRIHAASTIQGTPYVDTLPDDTQYQVMKLMWNLNLKHARVINISDIRNTKSQHFALEVDEINAIDDIHSIFCPERREELTEVIEQLDENAVIFKAWGKTIVDKSNHFRQLVKNYCLPSLPEGVRAVGIQGNSRLHFNHPLPQGGQSLQKQWVKDAYRLLVEV